MDISAIDIDGVTLDVFDLGTQIGQGPQQDPYIGDVGNVFNSADAFDKQRCRNNGNGCVLRAADGDGTV